MATSRSVLPSRARSFLADYGIFCLFAVVALIGIGMFFVGDTSTFERLLAEFWLGALLGVMVLEGAMMLYFAPSESLVPIAVTFTESIPQYVAIIAVSVVGATTGQYALFRVARRGGREYLLEKPWFRVSDETLAKFERWFDRWGAPAVAVSNTLLFTRGMLTVPAGFSEMDDRTFVLYSAIGTLSFQTILALLTLGVLSTGILDPWLPT